MHRLVVDDDQTNGDVSNHSSNKHETVDNCHGDEHSIRSLKKKGRTLVLDRYKKQMVLHIQSVRNTGKYLINRGAK